MGEILFLPVVRSVHWSADLQRVADAGFRLIALTPSPTAQSIHDVTRTPDDRVALLLGAEGPGLSQRAMALAERVRIPLRTDADSLNVGHAAAVAFALLAAP
jgi:tRNA G18 (ribose-2'-O)-methylase SpoU